MVTDYERKFIDNMVLQGMRVGSSIVNKTICPNVILDNTGRPNVNVSDYDFKSLEEGLIWVKEYGSQMAGGSGIKLLLDSGDHDWPDNEIMSSGGAGYQEEYMPVGQYISSTMLFIEGVDRANTNISFPVYKNLYFTGCSTSIGGVSLSTVGDEGIAFLINYNGSLSFHKECYSSNIMFIAGMGGNIILPYEVEFTKGNEDVTIAAYDKGIITDTENNVVVNANSSNITIGVYGGGSYTRSKYLSTIDYSVTDRGAYYHNNYTSDGSIVIISRDAYNRPFGMYHTASTTNARPDFAVVGTSIFDTDLGYRVDCKVAGTRDGSVTAVWVDSTGAEV